MQSSPEATSDPRLVGRRLILKLGVTGAAGVLAGVGHALPGAAATASPEAAGAALSLPCAKNVIFIGSRTVIADRSGREGEYVLNGMGSVFIDARGHARLIGLKLSGKFASGNLDLGPINIESAAGGEKGQYRHDKLVASGAVLFSGGRLRRQRGHAAVSGSLSGGANDMVLSVDFPGQASSGVVIRKRPVAA